MAKRKSLTDATVEAAAPGEAAGRRALALILAGYLVLALAYNLATPFGAPPDEKPHADYVRYLVEHRRLPVLRRGDASVTYEAHQPPLFYLLATPLWATFGGTGETGRRGEVAARVVRGLNALIGAVGLVLLWALARTLYRTDRWLPVVAVAFAAFLPMRLMMAAAVTNDLLLEALFTGSLLVMALMIRQGYTHRRALVLGGLIGAAFLTKATAALLFPVALLALLLASRIPEPAAAADDSRGRRRAPSPAPPRARLDAVAFFGGCLRTFGVAGLLAGPWLLRNRALYGDLLGQRVFEQYFQHAPLREQFLAGGMTAAQYWFGMVIPWTYRSFWGAFGHMDVWMPRLLYTLLLLPTLLGLLGALLHLGRGRHVLDEGQRAVWLTLWLCLFLVISGFLRFNTVFFQAQGRYLSPAMAPIALLMAIGWFVFVPPRARPAFSIALCLAMAALGTYAVAGVIVPHYT